MQDLRSIAENIAVIRIRRSELAAMKPVDRGLAEELSDLEARTSLFEETCTRHHRVNLCQAGFVYGDVLRHPAHPDVGVAVRLGDKVEIVEGMSGIGSEMTIVQATALLDRTEVGSPPFRDWHVDGRSLGQREDDLIMHGPRGETLRRSLARIGVATDDDDVPVVPPTSPRPAATHSPGSTAIVETGIVTGPPSAKPASGPRRPPRPVMDDRMPDLFG